MKGLDQWLNDERAKDRREPVIPDYYLPAMWPIGLQTAVVDWFRAWRTRRLYRRLLRLSDRQLRMRDLSRPRLLEKAHMPLRQLRREQRQARGRH
ncbi:hypothetical protein [Pseudomonas sp.]|uniref:hypothetical protein n=1 Tax=Pseudomonas sp. TaxID=306 RepID=UPI0028A613F1|nr:hypothetical protein [Pseudomonas sp.]